MSGGLTAGHQRLAAVQEPAVLCAHRTPRSNEKNKRYHQRVMVAQPMCVDCYNLSALVAEPHYVGCYNLRALVAEPLYVD